MSAKLYGIVSANPIYGRLLAEKLSREGYITKTFDDPSVEFLAKVLGVTPQRFRQESFQSAYLGEEWSYVREERFVEKGEVERKPVRYFLSPKTILKKFRDLARQVHSNFLANALFADYNPAEKWVITEVQFPNEIDVIREHGGVIVHIGKTGLKREDELQWDPQSESELDHIVKLLLK
jgi:hypothetical protein